jgi:hypothetical protein
VRQKWRPCRAVVEEGALVQLFPCNARKSGLRNFSLSLSLSLSRARESGLRNARKSGSCIQTAGGQSFRMVPNP